MNDVAKKPFSGRIHSLEGAISRLEGWAFGPALFFSSVGYSDQLRISGVKDGGEVEAFARLPDLRKFADDLNAAMAPVISAYAKRLRYEMALECVRVAEAAIAAE